MARPNYPNGQIPQSKIAYVAGVPLYYRTARAVQRFIAYAKSKGHTITIAKPIGGLRQLAVQREMQNRANWPRLNIDTHMTVSVAAPGYSTHGWGTAVDFLGDFDFIHKYAPHFGFSWTFGANDRNHWQHDNATAVSVISLASLTVKPAKPQLHGKMELTMLVRYAGTEAAHKSNKGSVWLISEFTHQKLTSEDLPVYRAALGTPIDINRWENIVRLVDDSEARAKGLVAAVASAAALK